MSTTSGSRIPKLIHQTWKTAEIPARWQDQVASVKRLHPDWTYKLWTDEAMDAYVKQHHPDLYPTFAGYDKPIMRADAIRYVLMYDFGGLYCDLDFEFLRPYPYGEGDPEVLLSWEFDPNYGDEAAQIANYFFASVKGHQLWRDVIDEMITGGQQAVDYPNVIDITGPGMLSRVFLKNRHKYRGIKVTERPVFSPRRLHGSKERKIFLNGGITYGFHHGSGSWKERLSWVYIKTKLKRLLGIKSGEKIIAE